MDEVVELELVDRAGVEVGEAIANVLKQRPQLGLVVGGDQLSNGLTVGALFCTASRVVRTGHGQMLRLRSQPGFQGREWPERSLPALSDASELATTSWISD